MIEFKNNIKEVTNITTVTLVGYIKDTYPMERGNCFSVECSDKQGYRIINFNYENLKELIKRKIINFPTKISTLSESVAIIADERIPNEWYSNRFCETCTPKNLLPLTQQLQHFLDIERGIRVESEIEINGKKITMVSIRVGNVGKKEKE